MDESSEGKTYSQVSGEYMAASKADPTAQATQDLGQLRQTLFMGTTLRGMLLNAYAFATLGHHRDVGRDRRLHRLRRDVRPRLPRHPPRAPGRRPSRPPPSRASPQPSDTPRLPAGSVGATEAPVGTTDRGLTSSSAVERLVPLHSVPRAAGALGEVVQRGDHRVGAPHDVTSALGTVLVLST